MVYSFLYSTSKGDTEMEFHWKRFEELSGAEVYEILKARAAVFMMEQEIRYLDMDDVDYRSFHGFITDGSAVVAYLRAFADEAPQTFHIGRVLTTRRGVGLGRELMERSAEMLRRENDCRKLILHSQVGAAGFYEKLGFCAVGGEFVEAGIPHVAMERRI